MSELDDWQESFANQLLPTVSGDGEELDLQADECRPPGFHAVEVLGDTELIIDPSSQEIIEDTINELPRNYPDSSIEEFPQVFDSELINVGGLVFDRVEADSYAALRKSKPKGENQVCICGHNVKRHRQLGDRLICCQSTFNCFCKNLVPIYEIQDSRFFMGKTLGPGVKHALFQGVTKHEAAGKTLTPLREINCMKCEEKNGMLLPSPLTPDFRIAYKDTGYNTILCSSCFASLRH